MKTKIYIIVPVLMCCGVSFFAIYSYLSNKSQLSSVLGEKERVESLLEVLEHKVIDAMNFPLDSLDDFHLRAYNGDETKLTDVITTSEHIVLLYDEKHCNLCLEWLLKICCLTTLK